LFETMNQLTTGRAGGVAFSMKWIRREA